MKRNIKFLLWCGLVIILNVSCQNINISPVSPSATPENSSYWWISWLAQPVCTPPCWQHITPGLTTINEAESILERMPNTVITYNSKYGLTWNFGTKAVEGNISMSEDRIVSSIWLANSSNQSLYLKDIVNKYGFPKYVKPYDCREGMCTAVLVYPDFGMLLDIFIMNKGTVTNPQIEILPDTVIDRVYFIEQGIENFQKIPDFQEYDLLMKWKDYGEYP